MDVTTTLAERIPAVMGAVFFGYGLINRLTGRMEAWKAAGFIALGHFFVGMACAIGGTPPFTVLTAGLAAYNGHQWWTGGGAQQFGHLMKQSDPK